LLELELHDPRHGERPEPGFTPDPRQARRADLVQLSLNRQDVRTEGPVSGAHDEAIVVEVGAETKVGMASVWGGWDMVLRCRPVLSKVARGKRPVDIGPRRVQPPIVAMAGALHV
jgi:hypothetical protein